MVKNNKLFERHSSETKGIRLEDEKNRDDRFVI